MRFSIAKACFVNDDGSAIKTYVSLCIRFGNISDNTTSKSNRIAYGKAMIKDLMKVEGDMDGLVQIDGHYRSKHLMEEKK